MSQFAIWASQKCVDMNNLQTSLVYTEVSSYWLIGSYPSLKVTIL